MRLPLRHCLDMLTAVPIKLHLHAGGAPKPAGQQQQQQQRSAQGGQAGADGQQQQQGADGEAQQPPVDNRTWWQKNWLFVMAGGTFVSWRMAGTVAVARTVELVAAVHFNCVAEDLAVCDGWRHIRELADSRSSSSSSGQDCSIGSCSAINYMPEELAVCDGWRHIRELSSSRNSGNGKDCRIGSRSAVHVCGRRIGCLCDGQRHFRELANSRNSGSGKDCSIGSNALQLLGFCNAWKHLHPIGAAGAA
jgi:hypothetical protein